MPQAEKMDVLVLGSGIGGKLLAWHLARKGHGLHLIVRRTFIYRGEICALRGPLLDV